jgi:response regulator RpfG family c-di-GMP phosphodiesterase
MASHSIGTILVVDDEAKLRFVLGVHLRAAGFEVCEAQNGRQAIEQAREKRPDIIFMDLSMPVMDGISSTRELKTDPRTRHIPVIILTARTQPEDMAAALDAGAQDYLRKPFDLTELLARVRTVHRLVLARRELSEINERLEQEVGVKTRRLEILYDYMQELNRANTRDRILDLLLDCVRDATGATRISIMVTDGDGENLVCERAIGIDPSIVKNIKVTALQGISGQVFSSGKTLAAIAFGESSTDEERYDRHAFLSTPLVSNTASTEDNILGVINVTEKGDDAPFSENEVACVRSIADAAAIALDNVKRSHQLEQSVRVLLQTVGHLAEYRDEETTLHLERVSKMARILAGELSREGPYASRVSEDFVEMLAQAAPMHDIGKVGIPDEILTRPGKLTDAEFEIMRTHTEIGCEVLSLAFDPAHPVPLLNMCIDIAYCHHERYNGSGYPQGLVGEAIPLSARILALVDAYDAITSRRRYKREKPHAAAVDIVVAERGAHFDPVIVDAFLRCQDEFDAVRATYEEPAEQLAAATG